jgi:hypothetical protein
MEDMMAPYTMLDRLPIGLLLIIDMGILAAAFVIGLAWGQYVRRHFKSSPDSSSTTIVSAALGLLAFLLSITFGVAASLFEARRNILLDETNAIGTAWLRTSLLPEPYRTATQNLLRQYVDVRISAVRSGRISEGVRRSEMIHGQLWSQAAAVGNGNPDSITVGLFISSLNDVIDLHTKRITFGLRTRIPAVAWLALYLVAFFAMALVGQLAGTAGTYRFLATAVLILACSVVLVLIADLDRPGTGFIKVSQQPLLDLQRTMK